MNEHGFEPWFFLNNELSIRWTLALLHFIWQGALIGMLVVLGDRLLRNGTARARYWLHSAAFLGFPVCVALTFIQVNVPDNLKQAAFTIVTAETTVESTLSLHDGSDGHVRNDPSSSLNSTTAQVRPAKDPQRVESGGSLGNVDESTRNAASTVDVQTLLSNACGWFTAVYGLGVVGFFLRLGFALWGGQRLRSGSTRLTDPVVLRLVVDLSRKIGLWFVPTVTFCERVAVPTVVGVLRPMVLLPGAILNGLSPDEFTAIMTHELAHIRRYDLWMNLLQRVIEALLFFHPVVWYVSRRLSVERELCCDDLVVSLGHARLNYAGALLRMAELCVLGKPQTSTALAVSGNNPSLFEQRIERLMATRQAPRLQLTRSGFLALILGFASLLAIPNLLANWTGQKDSESTPSQVSVDPERTAIQEISGVVLGPLAGVDVSATFELEERAAQSQLEPKYKPIKKVRVQTDAEGKYQVTVPKSYQGNTSLLVSFKYELEGYLPRLISRLSVEDFQMQEIKNDEPAWRHRQRSTESVRRTHLRRGTPLTGRVLLPDGTTAIGATVATDSKYRAYSWKEFDPGDYPASSLTTTDRNGNFQLLTDTSATLIIQLAGHAPLLIDDLYGSVPVVDKVPVVSVRNEDPEWTFRLPNAIRARGKVRDFQGKPIAGAIVLANRSFVWDEFHMPLPFSVSCAANLDGEFELPPLPEGKYEISVAARVADPTRIGDFNRELREQIQAQLRVLVTSPLQNQQNETPIPKSVLLADVIPFKTVELKESEPRPELDLQAVETITATVKIVDEEGGRPKNDNSVDVTVHGMLDGKPWWGVSRRADADGLVRLIAPKGVQNLTINTGHAFHRRQPNGPLELGDAIHLGTVDADVNGLVVIKPLLGKLHVHLKLSEEFEQGANRRQQPIHIQAYYARSGFREQQPGVQRVYVTRSVQNGNAEYQAQVLPNEEIVLHISRGIASNQTDLYEQRLTLKSGEVRDLKIDLPHDNSIKSDTSNRDGKAGQEKPKPDVVASTDIDDAKETAKLEVRYPYCLVNTENLKPRSLVDAITTFNRVARESPIGLVQPPITELETRAAITKFAEEKHVPESVRKQLVEINSTGTLPANAYFRRFTRLDDEQRMHGVWWVRLVVEDAPGLGIYSVPVRTTLLYSRPYTQMERQQNADSGKTLIGRVSSYYEQMPTRRAPTPLPPIAVELLTKSLQEAIQAKDIDRLKALFEWKGTSDSIRKSVSPELQSLIQSEVHAIKVTPRSLDGNLITWSAWQRYQPNLPVVGFLDVEYTNAADKSGLRKTISLELGLVGDELRLVNYVPQGDAKPPLAIEPVSIRGHMERLADGRHSITDIITNPGTLLSGHLANEEVWQRDFRNRKESE